MTRKLTLIFSLVVALAVPATAQQIPIGPYGQIPFRVGNTAVDTATLIVGQLTGLLTGTPTAAATYTTPTATLICAATPFVASANTLNYHWEWNVKNTSGGANTITVAGGTGVTIVGTATIAQNNLKRFMIVLNNCAAGSQSVTIISLGTVVF